MKSLSAGSKKYLTHTHTHGRYDATGQCFLTKYVKQSKIRYFYDITPY